MAGVLPPAIRPAHCEEQLCDRENEGELLVPGTHRANLSPKVTIITIIISIIMNHEHHDNNDDGRPNESFESPRKSRDCWSSGWGADSYEETVSYHCHRHHHGFEAMVKYFEDNNDYDANGSSQIQM